MAVKAESYVGKHGVAIALGLGGLGVAWLVASQAGGSGRTLWPRTYGGQRGQSSRSSSTSNDSGSLATQVIGDIIGQKTALAEAHDQLLETEASLTEQQNVAYRESNVQTQLSLNSEVPPPNGWTQIIGQLLGDAPMAFGFPPIGGGSSGSMFPGGSPGGYGGYYPQMSFPSPYPSAPYGGYNSGSSGGFTGFMQWLYSIFSGIGGGSGGGSGGGGYSEF